MIQWHLYKLKNTQKKHLQELIYQKKNTSYILKWYTVGVGEENKERT